MRRQPDLAINGLLLPVASAGRIEQTYEPIGGISTPRMADGTAIRQRRWRKLRTTLSASGWVPVGCAQIDWDDPVTLGCVATRGIQSTLRQIALPSARRSDAPPYGFAVMPGGLLRPTSVSIVGDLATLDEVTGASAYAVHYYPVLTVYTDGPRERYDAGGAVSGWDLVGEEV